MDRLKDPHQSSHDRWRPYTKTVLRKRFMIDEAYLRKARSSVKSAFSFSLRPVGI